MIQILKYSVLCLTALILFTSCESNLSITKRRYNKGYHIDHIKDQANLPVKKHKKLEDPTGTISTYTYQTENIENLPNGTTIPTLEEQQYQSNSIQNTSPITPTTNKTIVKHQKRSTVIGSVTIADHEDGLSFFWVVILIILILWVLGLLSGGFGLGGLLNLLWIIALILLILWLLRVI